MGNSQPPMGNNPPMGQGDGNAVSMPSSMGPGGPGDGAQHSVMQMPGGNVTQMQPQFPGGPLPRGGMPPSAEIQHALGFGGRFPMSPESMDAVMQSFKSAQNTQNYYAQ